MKKDISIAVVIPCYNESLTIAEVVRSFKDELHEAEIYVFDNNSTDNTAEEARKAGAIVINEPMQGKGHVVRSMFRYVESDIYVMVDGDSTYPVDQVNMLIEPVSNKIADMAVGDRHSSKAYSLENTRRFHGFGNHLISWLINKLFRSNLKDIMSGYRVFNRYFAKTFPVMSEGFEIEAELTLHALDKKFNIVEIPIGYRERPRGSFSKLNTYLDGIRILKTIFLVFKDYKPFIFFSVLAAVSAFSGLVIGLFPIFEYLKYSYVYKIPSAILASTLVVLSLLLFICGIILDTIVKQNKAVYELYLNRYWSSAVDKERE